MAGQGALEFRKDINGLRAYAVIAVLLYHFGIAGMGGGYAGVDVFFVISGFLMTAIIQPGVEEGRFSLSGFYLARVRRILPALAVLCAAVLLFGWFWLAPYLYENLGKSAGASLLFISNFVYNRAGGYFAEPAHDNWLLHTWSLSVEWQFYLLYPLLLLALARLVGSNRRFVRATLLAALLASFAHAVWLTSAKPTSAFFMLPARAWELLAGSLVFLYSGALSDKSTRVLEALGLVLILGSFAIYDSSTPWPGHSAALPVLGACLVLVAARQASPWTGNRIAQGLGRWSYSIYLWHWPLVVGLGYFGVRAETGWLLVAMVASIVLGALSYRLVEQPSARWMRGLDSRKAWRVAGTGFALAFGFAAVAYFDHGVARTWRLPESVLVAAREKENSGRLTKCNTAQSRCVLGRGKPLALVWGDSHAIAAVSGVAAAAERAGGSILFFGQQACPVIFGARSSSAKAPEFCSRFNDMVYEQLQTLERGLPVIVIHRAGAYIEPGDRLMYFDGSVPDTPQERRAVYERHLVDSLCRIAARNPLYVVQPMPEMPYDVPAVVAKELIVHGKAPQPAMSLSAHRAANASMNAALQSASRRCGVRLLDPLPYLCAGGSCEGVSDGRPLYSDDNHLSEHGAHRLAPMFGAIWQ
ncbi:MAG: acyltransferase family protein [Pseudomonadota bacterium]